MEKAFHESLIKLYSDQIVLYPKDNLVHEYGLSANLPVMTHVWMIPNKANEYYVAMKGSPETVLELCNLNNNQKNQIEKQIESLASEGLRVLGVAESYYTKNQENWPSDIDCFSFKWLGLVALKDPLRKDVPSAVKQCKDAGIRVVMITGDHATTAQAIARQAGIYSKGVLSGAELEQMDDEEFNEAVNSSSIFVRIKPHQKLRLVKAFQNNLNIVAMTGDGINDAPALKVAHVGISMGQRGTDVAREASSLVLLNDDFTSIVNTVKQGRQIYDNLCKAVIYIIAIHIPIAGSVFFPIVLGFPPILSPIHILVLQMIIDPACAIVFEKEAPEEDLMNRPPRKASSKIFSSANIIYGITQGIGLMFVVLGLYLGLQQQGKSLVESITISFMALVFGNLLLIVVNRSRTNHLFEILKKPNSSQNWIICAAIILLTLLFVFPVLRNRFQFSAILIHDLLLILTASLISLIWFELTKLLFKRYNKIISSRT